MSGLCKEEYAIHVINLAKTLPSDIHLSTIIHLSVHDQSPQTQALLPTGRPQPEHRPTRPPKRNFRGRAERFRPPVRAGLTECSARIRDDGEGPSYRLSGPNSSLERARPLADRRPFARPIRGRREWDEYEHEHENKNEIAVEIEIEAERRHDERTVLRRRRQANERRSRRATRKILFWPGSMASIARRSPNGRGVSFRMTCEWVRKIPVQNFSRSRTKRSFSPTVGAPASRSMTRM